MKLSDFIASLCRCACCVVAIVSTSANVATAIAQEDGSLYGIDRGTLVEIDRDQQAITPVGATGFTVGGLAYDDSSMTLFGVDSVGGQLLSIDAGSGQAQVVGATGFDGLVSLAYVPRENALYSVSTTSAGPDPLVRIDPSTGVGESVGSTGFDGFGGLVYDPLAEILYGAGSPQTSFQEELVQIDVSSGAVISLGTLALDNIDGLTFDPVNGVLIASEVRLPDILSGALQSSIFDLDTENGATAQSIVYPLRGITALTIIPDAIPEPGSGCVLMLGLTAAFLSRRRR